MCIVYGKLLYIDPGTGSMLIAVAMGIFATLVFAMQGLLIKAKSIIGIKRNEVINKNKLNYVIFSDHKRYWNVFKPICDEFEKRGIEVNFWTQSPDDPALSENYKYVKTEFIGEGNKGFYKLNMMNARVCLSTTPDLDVTQWKRSKNCDKYVHIFHNPGVNSGGYKMFGLDFYDVVLAVSEEQTLGFKELEEKRNIKKKEYCVVGSTYLDALYEKAKSLPKIDNKTPVVLVATSWGESSLLEKYKFKVIDELKKTGFKIVIRPHPQMYSSNPKLMEEFDNKYKNDQLVEINKDNDNIHILNRANLLITDFSGVIFDYVLIFNKPAMFMNVKKDLSTYDACWFDDKETSEKAFLTIGTEINDNNINDLNENVIGLLKQGKSKFDLSKADKFWECRMAAAKNIVDYLLEEV